MEEFKAKQKAIYNRYVVKLDAQKIDLDRFGFRFGIRLKERKLKRLLTLLGIFSGTKVLDVGCRDGRFLNKLNAQYGTKGIGVDISFAQLRKSLQNNPFNNIYCVADAEFLPFKDRFFDFAFCFDTLEHLPHPVSCISEISRVLKLKAKVLIYTINQKDKYTWHWFLKKITSGRLGVDKGELGDHSKDNFLRVEDVIRNCKENNLKIVKLILFHSFFTLAFDEMWPRLLHSIYKVIKKDSNSESLSCVKSSKIIRPPVSIRICSYLADFILPVMELIDRLWAKKGYSNGFFVIAEKRD